METGKKVLIRLKDNVDIIFIVYAIKRWHSMLKIPQKYNKPLYAFVLSPVMLVLAWRYTDRIAHRYRHFLVKFCYPELRSIYGQVYENCDSHKTLADLPLDTSCWNQFMKEAPRTVKNVSKLYARFYLFQLLVVALLKRKFDLDMLHQSLLNISRSTLFLAGQTISMRVSLCLPQNYGLKVNTFRIWLLCYICSLCIYFERTDRVGQINNLVFAHVLIGWLKKHNLLGLPLSLPLMIGTVIKDKKKLDPITALLAMAATFIF
jgi:hypothetical protein